MEAGSVLPQCRPSRRPRHSTSWEMCVSIEGCDFGIVPNFCPLFVFHFILVWISAGDNKTASLLALKTKVYIVCITHRLQIVVWIDPSNVFCSFTWGIVFSDLNVVCRTACTALQVEVIIAESEVVACGPLQVPLTVGAVRIVGSWETRTVEDTPLTYVGTSTCCCKEFKSNWV